MDYDNQIKYSKLKEKIYYVKFKLNSLNDIHTLLCNSLKKGIYINEHYVLEENLLSLKETNLSIINEISDSLIYMINKKL